MDFFKNGVGWCQRHNPNRKPVKIARAHAPIFRKRAASLKPQALTKLANS